MPRFFCNDITPECAILTGEEALHLIRSLRVKIGESITLSDGIGNDYQTTVSQILQDSVVLTVDSISVCKSEPTIQITLYQALPKFDKLEFIVQKAVELGVFKIVPILCHRSVSRPDEKNMSKKLQRLNKISLEAAKQSGRGMIPIVEPLLDFKTAVTQIKCLDLGLLCYENSTTPLSRALNAPFHSIGVIVGCEGGFTSSEVEFAMDNGIENISLGSRILRCETAPIAVLCATLYQTGNF